MLVSQAVFHIVPEILALLCIKSFCEYIFCEICLAVVSLSFLSFYTPNII